MALAAKYAFLPDMTVPAAISLALLMGVIAQVSDLLESVMKRSSDMKDSASFLPGHGGILDRLDSVAFNGPVLYYAYYYFLSPYMR